MFMFNIIKVKTKLYSTNKARNMSFEEFLPIITVLKINLYRHMLTHINFLCPLTRTVEITGEQQDQEDNGERQRGRRLRE